MNEIIIDDMVFKPYMDCGYQCLMDTKKGRISVRFGCHTILTDKERPYEVWYPTEDTPLGYQTADDIWNYIKNNE